MTVDRLIAHHRELRRRFLRWMADRLEPLPLRLRFMAAEPYDPDKFPKIEMSDEEWESFQEALRD